MSKMLISLAMAKADLVQDQANDDVLITQKIQGATVMILRYLNQPDMYQDTAGDIPTDTAGDPIGVDPDVQIACSVLVGIMYRDRDGSEMEKWAQGYLPFPVTSLIYGRRDPAIA